MEFSLSDQMTGKAYAANDSEPTPKRLTDAVRDMQTAYRDAAGRANEDAMRTDLGAGCLGGAFGGAQAPLTPGIYSFGSNVSIDSDLHFRGTGVNPGQGDSDIFILQIAGNLVLGTNVQVILDNGAQAKNLFWQATGHAHVMPGAHMQGILLIQTETTLYTGASLTGRVLTQTTCLLQMATVTEPDVYPGNVVVLAAEARYTAALAAYDTAFAAYAVARGEITRLLIMTDGLKEEDVIEDSANSDTLVVRLGRVGDPFASLLAHLQAANISPSSLENVGCVSHAISGDVLTALVQPGENVHLERVVTMLGTVKTFLKPTFNRIDLLACRMAGTPLFESVAAIVLTRCGLELVASLDYTGNASMHTDTNWDLETHSINLQDLYFTDNLLTNDGGVYCPNRGLYGTILDSIRFSVAKVLA